MTSMCGGIKQEASKTAAVAMVPWQDGGQTDSRVSYDLMQPLVCLSANGTTLPAT